MSAVRAGCLKQRATMSPVRRPAWASLTSSPLVRRVSLLVQVKSNRWPGRAEMERLRALPVPPGCRREVHRWRDGAQLPDVREV